MKKLICIFFAAVLFVSAGCKKSFFDINQNPNSPTEESITPELLMPRAINRAAIKTASSYSNYAGWMGYWSRSGTYGPNPANEGYQLTSSFEADEWNDWYDILYDFDIMEKKATAKNQNYYVAVAKIMKSIGFMYLVDQYNNVPYSEAFNLTEHIQPKYDKGADIYADLIKQLNTAMDLLGVAGVASDPTIANVDIVYKGNATLWRKLANTQKLKLLIHESEFISAGTATAEIAKTYAIGYLSTITVPFAGAIRPVFATDEGAYVQPGYVADANKQNPFYDNYDTDFKGSLVNDYWRANNFLLYTYGVGSADQDARLTRVFDKAVTSTDPGDPVADYLGTNYGEIVPNGGPQAVNQADVSGPGLSVAANQAQWLFTVTESLFLQAEAAERGWIGGSAKTLYESAVTSSFMFLGVAANAADYIADFASYDDGGNNIKLIATQKYIAMAGINNFEGWVDYRRLDGAQAILSSPAEQEQLLSFSPERGDKQIPLRLIYAQSEYNYNPANVAAQGIINPQSSLIFWDKAKR